MKTNLEYELIVYGNKNKVLDEKHMFYPIIFRVWKYKNTYQVWIKIDELSYILCAIIENKDYLYPYIKKAMKLAMNEKFIYRECLFCGENNFYPLPKCFKCGILFYPIEAWKVINIKHEKKNMIYPYF